MSVTVKIPTQLRAATDGESAADVEGSTVGEVLDALYERYGELRSRIAEDVRASQGKASPFAVPAVPGARGYRVSAGGLFGDNVYFADGNFLYLVGQGWSSRDKKPPTRAALIAAVQKLYARVRGR